MRKFYLVFGSIAIIALGSAAACTSDDGGGGGSGGGDGGSGTGTGTGTGQGGSGTGQGGSGTGTGMGGGGTGGMAACIGCGTYLNDLSGTVEVADICGVDMIDEQSGTFTCAAGVNSCSFLADLQACTCDMNNCATECTDACMGGDISAACLGCVTNLCNTEFNACTGDTGTGG